MYGCVTVALSSSSPERTPVMHIKDLSADVHGSKADVRSVERDPFTEGFMLLPENKRESAPTKHRAEDPFKPAPSSNTNTSSTTTCKTITKSPSPGRLSRKLLDVPSYDTDAEPSPVATPLEADNNEIDSFLKVDEDEMYRQLLTTEPGFTGSGDSTCERPTPFRDTNDSFSPCSERNDN